MEPSETSDQANVHTEWMKRDWDGRARSDARWFINTARREDQAEQEFDRTGRQEVERLVRAELEVLGQGRDPRRLRLLEIGCGIGRMTRHLAAIFGEVQATDVSGEMVRRGAQRLRHLPNVTFLETNGVDFRAFADGRFDVILCAFVYQHVPSASVIRANLTDAFRVLAPGGVFKFQTNGVTNDDFRAQPKDTWAGDVFTADDVRQLARELGAQMLGVVGAGTQYCWSLWRRPFELPAAVGRARIEEVEGARAPGRARGFLCRPGPATRLTDNRALLVSGVDPNRAGIDSVVVRLDDADVVPFQVRPITPARAARVRHAPPGEARGWIQVDFTLPSGARPGPRPLTVRFADRPPSPAVMLDVPPRRPAVPRIVLVTNGADGGLDIEPHGPKSAVRIFVEQLDAWPRRDGLQVLIRRRAVTPDRISFVPGNNTHMLELRLPPDAPTRDVPLRLALGPLCSPVATMRVSPRRFTDYLDILRRRAAPGTALARRVAARLWRWR